VSAEAGVPEDDEMKKALITASVLVVVVVVAYLAFYLVRGRVVPCETIFQQTSLKLSSSLNLVRSRGPEVSIEEGKIQDLTERAQMSALNLKTCCIVLEGGKLSSEQFLRCKDDAERFGAQVEKVAATVDEARAAKQQGKPEDVQRKLRQIDQDMAAAAQRADELRTRVAALQSLQARTEPTQVTETRPGPSAAPHGGNVLITGSDGTTTPVYADSFRHAQSGNELTLQIGQSIPFEKMKTIDVITIFQDHATIRIALLDGRVVEGSIEAGLSPHSFTGQNDLGTFNIRVDKLKRIEFPTTHQSAEPARPR
jgi:hypothetical protein